MIFKKHDLTPFDFGELKKKLLLIAHQKFKTLASTY